MLMQKKKSATARQSSRLTRDVSLTAPAAMDRRTFLKRSGIGIGVGAVAGQLGGGMMRPAEAADSAGAPKDGKTEIRRTICTHCSVGCAIDAEVVNGVWVGQEPVFDSPINLGAHCAKGASVREHGHGEMRLKYPMKLFYGK